MSDILKDNHFRLSTRICDTVYTPDISLSELNVTALTEISLVTEGRGIHRVLNEVTECQAGDMYILSEGIHHGYFASDEGDFPTVCTISFKATELFEEAHGLPDSDSYCFGVFRDRVPLSYAMLNSRTMETVRKIIGTISNEINEQSLEWQASVKAQLVLLLVTVSRYIDMADTSVNEHSKEWIMVSSATKEIINRCNECDMTLESIAQKLYVSKSHLSRVFKEVTGNSFADYVRNIRIGLACNLLRSTNLKNEEIVKRCGLKDVPTFYRIFKKHIGKTPYQYRMSNQIYKGENNMSIYAEISENLQRGKAKVVKELVQQAVDQGLPAAQILNEGLLSGMSIIGEKFKNNEVYVPEVLVAARAMNMGTQILKPLLVDEGMESVGRVCIGTVQGDLHDIGKNLVKMMLEGKGLEVIDLGTDVSPEAFVQAAIDNDCQIICCSALLTTTMDVMAEVVKAAEAAGIRDKVKIMVGGAPITEEFCQRIGADKYTSDAASAAEAAVELLQ